LGQNPNPKCKGVMAHLIAAAGSTIVMDAGAPGRRPLVHRRACHHSSGLADVGHRGGALGHLGRRHAGSSVTIGATLRKGLRSRHGAHPLSPPLRHRRDAARR
jgi:hypothetical protein